MIMKKTEMNGKDLLLAFLYSPGIKSNNNEPIVGRTKLTKMMFLFEKQIYSRFFEDSLQIELPSFEPYFFGPFSRQLFEDLSFFESIGMIEATETNIPISAADIVESNGVFDEEDEWVDASFDEATDMYELSYTLSQSGTKYVEEKIWPIFTQKQIETLVAFKAQINRISLDSLLRYVYKQYPEEAKKSKIANRYLDKVEE